MAARRQLLERGVTARAPERRLRKRLLLPIHPGVYAMGGLALRFRGYWMAAVLGTSSWTSTGPIGTSVVEVDGYAFHKGRRAFEQDRARDLKLRLAGEHVARVTHRVIEHEAARLVADLRRLIGSTAA